MMKPSKGYPREIFKNDEVNPKYLCAHCHLVLRSPFQRYCGHRYCQCCLEANVSLKTTCPACVEEEFSDDELPSSDAEQAFPDMAVRREMAKILVECTSCNWNGLFKDFVEHYKEHEKDDSKCPLNCEIPMEEGDNANKHIGKFIAEHFQLVYTKLRNVQDKVKSLTSAGVNRLPQLEQDVEKLAKELNMLNITDSPSVTKLTTENLSPNFVANKLSTYEQEIMRLSNSIEDLIKGSTDIEKSNLERRRAVERINEALTAAEVHASAKDPVLDRLNKMVEDLLMTSYDGTLLWVVTGVAQKRKEAVSGQKISTFSPPFYTSRTGYKLCLRIYLNGDGSGKNTHLSVFFVVMRGNYDALLRWPFQHKVTLMLINQDDIRNNIADSFRPDPSSSSFRRPATDMNTASGCPKFALLTKIDNPAPGFVKDDRMFLKVIVEVP